MMFLLKMVDYFMSFHCPSAFFYEDFSVSPSPLWINLGFKLGWTGLGLGLKGLGTNGFGVGD